MNSERGPPGIMRPRRRDLLRGATMMETSREGWTPWKRACYDARAAHEEWEHARSILNPMAAIAREVGNASLSSVMDKVVAEVEEEVNRALDMREGMGKHGSDVS